MLGSLPRPGEMLVVDVELPANHAFGRRCMHCQAVVARVSASETGGAWVAFQVNQMQFKSYANGRHAAGLYEEAGCALM